MSEEKKPYLIINEEYDEMKINIKHTKPYMKLQQENKQLKEMFEDSKKYSKEFLYKHNKNLLEANKKLQQERDLYKEVIEEVRERVVELKKRFKQEEHQGTAYDDDLEYDELLQILDKAKEKQKSN